MERKREPLLPYSEVVSEKMAVKLRNPLSHCLYKRVIIWVTISLLMVGYVLFSKHDGSIRDIVSSHANLETPSVLAAVDSKTEQSQNPSADDAEISQAQAQIDAARKSQEQEQVQVTPEKNTPNQSSQDADDDDEIDNARTGSSRKHQSDSKRPSDKSTGKHSKTNTGGKTGKAAHTSESDEDKDEDEYETADEDVPEYDQHAEESEISFLLNGENTEQIKQELENLKKMPWLRFPQ